MQEQLSGMVTLTVRDVASGDAILGPIRVSPRLHLRDVAHRVLSSPSCPLVSEVTLLDRPGHPLPDSGTVGAYSLSHADERPMAGQRVDLMAELKGEAISFQLSKLTADEELGMDVKHVGGQLVVIYLSPSGAVTRANAERAAAGQSELKVGDTIRRVNHVPGGDYFAGSDLQMVAECRTKTDLTFIAVRPPSEPQRDPQPDSPSEPQSDSSDSSDEPIEWLEV